MYTHTQILTDYDMVSFLHKHLAPGASEDDIVLEIVIFIGTCIQDPRYVCMCACMYVCMCECLYVRVYA